jgi:hypothetical protein
MALTEQQIQKAYIAFFNRPADVSGLKGWLQYKGDDADLLATFAQSTEYTDLFTGKTPEQVVTTVYHNLFARAPDPSGFQNWVDNLKAGAISIGNIAYTMLNSAGPGDIDTIAAKLGAAESFTAYLEKHPSSSAGYENSGSPARVLVREWFTQIGESGSGEQNALRAVTNVGNKLGYLNDAKPGSDGVFTGTKGNDALDDNKESVVLNGDAGNDAYTLSFRGNVNIFDAAGNKDSIFLGNNLYYPSVYLEELTCWRSGKDLVLIATGHPGVVTLVDFYQSGHAIEELRGFESATGAEISVKLAGVANLLADGEFIDLV